MVLSSSTRQVSVSVVNRQPIGSKGCPTQPSRLVVEVTPLWRSSEGGRGQERKKCWNDLSTTIRQLCVCVCLCPCFTFLLVFVDVHLSLLLKAKRIDDCNGQSQGFPGVTVGTQGVNASTCCRDVVCVVDRKRKSFAIHGHRHAVSSKLWDTGCS